MTCVKLVIQPLGSILEFEQLQSSQKMIRIKTKIGSNYVRTLFGIKTWVTFYTDNCNKLKTIDSVNLYDAGLVHLQICEKLTKEYI